MVKLLSSVLIKRFAIAVLLCVFCLSILVGCSQPEVPGNNTPDSNMGNNAPPSVSPDKTPENTSDEALECNWLLKVDQTIPITENELTVNYTLVLIAQKNGGKDVYGTYEGAAFIGSTLDASNLSNSFLKVTGGFDIRVFANNLSFEIVPYDKESYSRYGLGEDGVPDVPLVDYESMALLSPEMTGTGFVNPHISGENVSAGYSGSSAGTAPVVMKIAVKSGKVHVIVPFLNMDRSFEGLLTGDPLGNTEDYQQALDRIETLIAESQQQADSDADDDNSGDKGFLDSMMGTIGTGLALPESFPADEFPLASDANILNVFESEDKKNVRIIYSTAMDYDDILAFYASVIEMMDTELDTDTGKMYMGSTEKYDKIVLMVNNTKTKSDSNMVTLEVTRK